MFWYWIDPNGPAHRIRSQHANQIVLACGATTQIACSAGGTPDHVCPDCKDQP